MNTLVNFERAEPRSNGQFSSRANTKMSDTNPDTTGEQLTVDQLLQIQQWLQIRKDAASKIDPETAEVMWLFGASNDPYNVYPDCMLGEYNVGRMYFARAPGSDIWVWFGDLPDEIQEKLLEIRRSQQAFPAEPFDRASTQ